MGVSGVVQLSRKIADTDLLSVLVQYYKRMYNIRMIVVHLFLFSTSLGGVPSIVIQVA